MGRQTKFLLHQAPAGSKAHVIVDQDLYRLQLLIVFSEQVEIHLKMEVNQVDLPLPQYAVQKMQLFCLSERLVRQEHLIAAAAEPFRPGLGAVLRRRKEEGDLVSAFCQVLSKLHQRTDKISAKGCGIFCSHQNVHKACLLPFCCNVQLMGTDLVYRVGNRSASRLVRSKALLYTIIR